MSKTLLQIKPYALIEFDYETTTISTTSSSFIIFNSSYTNAHQVLNATRGNNPTSNILDRSAVVVSNYNEFAHLDQDRAIPYDIQDAANLGKELLSDLTTTQWPVKYQTVKLHLLSGYNLEDLDGLLLSISFPEVSGKNCTVAQIAYLKGDEFIKFNARPIVISGRTYDRYLEVMIPSLFDLNSEFYANPTNGELAYWLSSDGYGFVKDGLINVELREISSAVDDGTKLALTTGELTSLTFKQSDAFSQLTAVIKENEEEDCFEYYPSWEGGFVEDLILDLNGVGGDYYIFHELYVYEQVSFSQIPTDYFVSLQEDGYNEPKRFRPVLKNAGIAYSFSIDYVMRLTDRGTGAQIIRTASVTSFDASRYGRNLDRVAIEGSVRSYKVYNKIVEETKIQVSRKDIDRKIEKVFTPAFFDFNEIAVNTSNVVLKTDGSLTAESVWNWDIIFGQGEAIILLHPFENYIKFKIHRYLQSNETQTIDLRYDVDLFLVVEYSGKRVKFSKLDSFFSANPAEGEVIFKIPSKEASSIYAAKSGSFYITSKVPSLVKVRVKDTFIGAPSGKEFNIISKEYYSKGDTDNIEIIYDNVPYLVPKTMMTAIQTIPVGSGVSETTIYTGKWRRMEDADSVKDDIEKIRRSEIEKILNQIKASQVSLDRSSSDLDKRAAELAALEAKLNAQNAALSSRDSLLSSLQNDLKGKEKVLTDREKELRDASRRAAESENSNIASFQDQLNKVLKALEQSASTPSPNNPPTGGGTTTTTTTPSDGSGGASSGNKGGGVKGSGKGISTNLPFNINLIDFPGRSGSDIAILPSLGFGPSDNKDTTTGDSGKSGSGKKVLQSGVNGTILNQSLSSSYNSSNLSLNVFPGTPINGSESNSGSTPNPPAGNSDKVVLGLIKDWVIGEEDESYFTYAPVARNSSGGGLGAPSTTDGNDATTGDRFFKVNIAVIGKKTAELTVDTTRYLQVGDLLIHEDKKAAIQITSITSPNKVIVAWTDQAKVSLLTVDTYTNKGKWTIERPTVKG